MRELGYGSITFTDDLDFYIAELGIVYEDSVEEV